MQAHICIKPTGSEGIGYTLERSTQLRGLVRNWINILGRYMIGRGLDSNDFTFISPVQHSPLCPSWGSTLPSLSLVFRTSWPCINSTVNMSCQFSILCNSIYIYVLILVIHRHSPPPLSHLMALIHIHHAGCVALLACTRVTPSSLVDILQHGALTVF